MYHKVCVPLNEASQTRAHVQLALTLGRAAGAKLTASLVRAAASRRQERMLATLPTTVRDQLTTAAAAPTDDVLTTELGWLQTEAQSAGLIVEAKTIEGEPAAAVVADAKASQYDLLVVPARGQGSVGAVCERLLRHGRVDTLVVKPQSEAYAKNPIVVCIDGSDYCYAGLLSALGIAKQTGASIEAVAVYDPYLHYTLFNGIVTVLSEQASKVFKFKDQEKLHEEIIDTGLAKIYQAHLEVARRVADEHGVDLKITLLDGKAFQKIVQYCRKVQPSLLVMGRIGVHSTDDMDIGSTAENLLRTVDCNVLVVSQKFKPRVDVVAAESIEWMPEAKAKMQRVPEFVRGVATTAILRWAMERGHSIITTSVINTAMGELLPAGAAQAMGYIAEEVAKAKDNLTDGKTFICPECGHAAKDFRPVACSVCKTEGAKFEQIDRAAMERLGSLEMGDLEEGETFDGVKLKWTSGANEVLRRVPSGYQRRRSKARIEKTAKVRGLTTITEEFALDMVQQELADTAYLTPRGETLQIEVKKDELPDDVVGKAREGSTLPWTDAAWKRILRVPEGFMRDMTRERVEQFAEKKAMTLVNLTSCEEGIAEGRKMMADMLGQYRSDKILANAAAKEAAKAAPQKPEATGE